MHVGAAEVFRRHHFAGGRLHQRRPGEEDGALPFHDDGLVAHRRHVGAARGAGAHHAGDLRDAGRAHSVAWLKKMRPKCSRSGNISAWFGRFAPPRIDQIDAGQPVLARDLLRAQMLLHRDRIVGAALDRGVVADDDAFAPLTTRPMPVMMPAAWMSPSYMPFAASGDSSRNGEPGSSSRSTRSRGSSLPRSVWRLRLFSSPPSAARAHLVLQFGDELPHRLGIGFESG